jgi:hypothetical protein
MTFVSQNLRYNRNMGIDFTHCDAHWSYGGFNRFRFRIAQSVGIDLGEMQGFGGSKPWTGIKDAIVPFLNHSDCDGTLGPKNCEKIAKRLREIVSTWKIDPQTGSDYDKRQAMELIKGMKKAAKLGQKLEFI